MMQFYLPLASFCGDVVKFGEICNFQFHTMLLLRCCQVFTASNTSILGPYYTPSRPHQVQQVLTTFSLRQRSHHTLTMGAQWLSGRVLDSRPKGRGFEPHRRHCIVSLSKNINPSLVLVQPRKTRPYITERLLMGRKESNQTKTHLPRSHCILPVLTNTMTGRHSAVGNVSGYRCVSDCRSRGRKFDPGPVPYFCGD